MSSLVIIGLCICASVFAFGCIWFFIELAKRKPRRPIQNPLRVATRTANYKSIVTITRQTPRPTPSARNARKVIQINRVAQTQGVTTNTGNLEAKRKYKVFPLGAANVPIQRYQFQPLPGFYVYVVEQKPQVRRIIDEFIQNKRIIRYISFPTTYFIIVFYVNTFAAILVYFTQAPINGLGSRLCHSALTNTWSSGQVCYGKDEEYIEINRLISRIPSARGKIIEIVNEFFATSFNNHLADKNMMPWGRIDSRLSSYEAWEEATKKNPDFILGIPWYKRTAGSVEYLATHAWRQ